MTPDTLFQIGSITKTFVSTAAMRLVQQGKLNLDVPLRYARFHMGNGHAADGEQLLDAAALQMMRTPQVSGGGYDAIGITWLLQQMGDTWIVCHSGRTNGQVALLTLVPERNFAISVLTNANQAAVCHAIV